MGKGINNNIKITNGKIGGKVPIDDYIAIKQASVKNPNSDTLTLGKYADDATSYTKRAGNTSYFDMGSDWSRVQNQYKLTDAEMFEYFNKPVLSDAISSGKTIRFSHDPRALGGGFLRDEWEFLKSTLNLTDSNLIFEGGFWYVK